MEDVYFNILIFLKHVGFSEDVVSYITIQKAQTAYCLTF